MTRNRRRHPIMVVALALVVVGTGCTMTMNDVSLEARSAIESRFPDAEVTVVEGKLGGLYEITLEHGEQVSDVKLHKDGTILEIETVILVSDLPKPVAEIVSERSGGRDLIKVERVEEFAKSTLSGIKKLDEPELFYEAKWMKGGFKRELKVNPDGSVR